jgi:hypothetical protein
MSCAEGDEGLAEFICVLSASNGKKASICPVYCSVLRKRRGSIGENCRVVSELLPECRTIRRSALILAEAVSLRQKPFAIGKPYSEDRQMMAA